MLVLRVGELYEGVRSSQRAVDTDLVGILRITQHGIVATQQFRFDNPGDL
jgi:hypothetical protein